ncbi:MAG: nuclear transport factor 2 family protein [Polyangiaceae bacterium]
MSIAPCPSDFALEALVLGELSAREAEVATHVASCAVCRGKVAAKRSDDADFAQSKGAAAIRAAIERHSPHVVPPTPAVNARLPFYRRTSAIAVFSVAAAMTVSLALSRLTRPVPAPPRVISSATNEEEVVLRVQREWMEAIRDKDAVALDRILADDYTYTDSRGGVTNKADSLRQARSQGGERMKSFQTTDTRAHVFGDTAVVTGRLRVEGEAGGKTFEAEVRFTDILSRIDGQWRAVAAHASRLADKRAP